MGRGTGDSRGGMMFSYRVASRALLREPHTQTRQDRELLKIGALFVRVGADMTYTTHGDSNTPRHQALINELSKDGQRFRACIGITPTPEPMFVVWQHSKNAEAAEGTQIVEVRTTKSLENALTISEEYVRNLILGGAHPSGPGGNPFITHNDFMKVFTMKQINQ
jgi:hypothetical protein